VRRDAEIVEESADAAFDLARMGGVGHGLAGGVVKGPVEVALAGQGRAGVTAARGDDDIGGPNDFVRLGLGAFAGDVDARPSSTSPPYIALRTWVTPLHSVEQTHDYGSDQRR
jgi:hypothetical protein